MEIINILTLLLLICILYIIYKYFTTLRPFAKKVEKISKQIEKKFPQLFKK